jgi:hypothetical protein
MHLYECIYVFICPTDLSDPVHYHKLNELVLFIVDNQIVFPKNFELNRSGGAEKGASGGEGGLGTGPSNGGNKEGGKF